MTTVDQDLSLLPAEQRELLRGLNELTGDVPPGTVAAAVAALSAERGSCLAARGPARELTRADLLVEADRLAAALLELRVTPGQRVALCVEPGVGQIIGLLGILRAGAVVLPIDPVAGHVARWRAVERSSAAVLVSQRSLLGQLGWPERLGVLAVDDLPRARTPLTLPDLTDGHAAACVVGGAETVLRHRDLLNLVADLADRFGIGQDDRVLALTPLTSGRGVQETAIGLLTGAALVFCEDADARNSSGWPALMTREQITVWHATPYLLDLLVTELEDRGEGVPEQLRLVLVSGERLPVDLTRRLGDLAGQGVTVANLSAAEPDGSWVACHAPAGEARETPTVPIGRPIRNQRVHVLAENGSDCPAWVTGQVYYGGLVAETVNGQNDSGTVHPATGERLRPTTQYGRVLPDGVVEIVGDASAQLLVHGRRLHVHDTEVALAAMPEVRSAAVVTVADGTESRGFVRLLAGASITGADLLDRLRRKVSPYLLPSRIEVLDRFPLTADGRVDRPELAAMHGSAASRAAEVAPEVLTRTDADLLAAATAIACRVLNVSEIEPDTNLLDLGVTSVELVRLATLAEDELDIEVEVEELLNFPSISMLIGPQLAKSTEPVRQEPTRSPDEAEDLLVGVVKRHAFKDRHMGVRHEHTAETGFRLGGNADPRLFARRTERRFSPAPVVFADLALLLGALRSADQGGESKFWYPSAGNAYPLGVYLEVAPHRVRDLDAGIYYVRPDRAELVPVTSGGRIPATAHADLNQAALEESAFTLYLVSRMDAITPLYGELAWDFSVFEAGAMTQLLMSVAAETGLGLCSVGTLDSTELTEPLQLQQNDRFVHALLGGIPHRDGTRAPR
ncbi:AMP-binding protein [Lentzea sp. NPDC060358]|uniref:AMP-binding protein n=1 Tax=Lentzea sp. NPDC060358 TaxID=3347103 RepID=UPI003646E901